MSGHTVIQATGYDRIDGKNAFRSDIKKITLGNPVLEKNQAMQIAAQLWKESEDVMDCAKTGGLIATLRKEKGMTQKNLADALGISNKTVSKWECGMGSPDLSFWSDLSAILGADITQMLEGEITVNKPDSGNLYRLSLYVCPHCGNLLVSTGGAAIYCCGKKTEVLSVSEEAEQPQIIVENSDIDYYVTVDHPMRKDHYLSAAVYVNNDRVLITRLYPEQSASFRIPVCRGGRLYLYCIKHGLSMYTDLF